MVKAPERMSPPSTGAPESQPVSRRKFLRNALIGGGVAVVAGSGIGAATLIGSEGSPKKHVPSVGKKGSHETPPTTPEKTPLTDAQKLQQNIEAAFALTDEQIKQYGVENPITYRDRGEPWSFPYWYNNTSFFTSEGKTTSLDYSTGFSLKPRLDSTFEPNFSILGVDFQDESFKLLPIRLGSVDEPLSSGGTQRIGAYFLKLPSQMGGYRFVVFATENVRDPSDGRFKKGGPIQNFGASPTIEEGTQYDFSDSQDRQSPSLTEFYKKLDQLDGKPVVLYVDSFIYPPEAESVVPGINAIVSKNRDLYDATMSLFQGNPSAFNTSLQKAAGQGLVVLPDNPVLPEWVTQGRQSFEEYLGFAPLVAISYFKGITPLLKK